MNEIKVQRSARQVYHEHEEQIHYRLKQIAQDVRLHSRRFLRDGATDWGFVGDLAHIEEQLTEIYNFMNNQE